MPDLNKRIDPLSFPILGLLGAFACGPVAPQDTDSGSTDGSGSDPSTAGSDPTTTASTDPTDPTSPTTTETPECQSDADCGDSYCGYCVEGMCRQSPECYCGVGVAVRVADKWRCSPPYECYSDDECEFGYACLGGLCSESQPIPLPGCEPPDGQGTAWNLGDAPTAFILADLDGDLDLDLAAAEPASGNIEIMLNDGAGNFVLAGAFGVGPEGSGDLALAAGDLDGDGDLDLAVTRHEEGGVLRLLFNDGAVFTVGEPMPVAALPVQVFIADINSDAIPDLLTLNEAAPNLGVLFGIGKGQFSPQEPLVADTVVPRAFIGDVTLDGRADMLAPTPDKQGFTVWQGEPPVPIELRGFFIPEAKTMAVLAGDLDLQGLPDLVLVHPFDQGGMVQVWSGTAPANWSFGRRRFTTLQPLTGSLLAELDATPGPELISATGQGTITVLRSDGLGGFTCELGFTIQGNNTPDLLAVGDVTGDGRPDIVAGGLGVFTISVISPLF